MNKSLCISCNTLASGMINIFQHPNQLDEMFTYVTGLNTQEIDHLCINCYEQMKSSSKFKENCLKFNASRLKAIESEETVLETIIYSAEKSAVPPKEDLTTPGAILVYIENPESDLVDAESNIDNVVENSKIEIPSSSLIHLKATRKRPTKNPETDIFRDITELTCVYCFEKFLSIELKQEHLLIHQNQEKPFKCPDSKCQAEFKHKSGIRLHYQIHHFDFRPFKCINCNLTFHQRSNLVSHERTHHSGVEAKKHLCSICGSSFKETGNLKAHMKMHFDIREFQCTHCPKKFRTHYSHKIHIRSHTKELPYSCKFPDCGKNFISSGKLLMHSKTHSSETKPYKCIKCSSTFTNSSNLKRHVDKIHNKNK